MSQTAHDSRTVVRVLVADADDDTRSLYRTSLSLAGCDVVDAADGRDALVKALSHRPTVVVTETQLPIFDGYALCEVLRRDSVTRGVPIVVVTADQGAALDRARDAGADVVLVKPVSPDALLKEIHRLIRPPSAEASEPSPGQKTAAVPKPTSLVKAHVRFQTKSPPGEPPQLVCPSCDGPLMYVGSHVGGVSNRHPEQWDEYVCPAACGKFVYRHRTRRLRQVS